MIGYKLITAETNRGNTAFAVAKLEIPESAKVVQPRGGEGKMRASTAMVLEIRSPYDGRTFSNGCSLYHRYFGFEPQRCGRKYSASGRLDYVVGKWVIPDAFDDSIGPVCTNGIHFFREVRDIAPIAESAYLANKLMKMGDF